MKVIGKEELIEPLNRAALKIARKVADLKSTGPKPNLMAEIYLIPTFGMTKIKKPIYKLKKCSMK